MCWLYGNSFILNLSGNKQKDEENFEFVQVDNLYHGRDLMRFLPHEDGAQVLVRMAADAGPMANRRLPYPDGHRLWYPLGIYKKRPG